MVSPRLLNGSCACRAVKYTVKDAFQYALNCHCSNCRRATGSAFKSLAGISRDKLTIVEGQDKVKTWGDTPDWHSVNCSVCGSLLYCVVDEGGKVHVLMGTLVDEPSIKPNKHIFVGSKAKWYEITDDLAQFEEFPV